MTKQVTVTMSWRQVGLVAEASARAEAHEDGNCQNEIKKAIVKLIRAAKEGRPEIRTTTDGPVEYRKPGQEARNG